MSDFIFPECVDCDAEDFDGACEKCIADSKKSPDGSAGVCEDCGDKDTLRKVAGGAILCGKCTLEQMTKEQELLDALKEGK